MKCPECNGLKTKRYFVPYMSTQGKVYFNDCEYCKGKGKVNYIKYMFWKFFYQKRHKSAIYYD